MSSAHLSTNGCVLCLRTLARNRKIGKGNELEKLCSCLSNPYSEETVDFGEVAVVICQECRPLVKSALAEKENVKCVEKGVRKLQMQLLKEMRHLQGAIQKFYEEMNTINVFMEDNRLLEGSNYSSKKRDPLIKENQVFEKTVKQVMTELSFFGITLTKKTDTELDALTTEIQPETGSPSKKRKTKFTDNLPQQSFADEDFGREQEDCPESDVEFEEDSPGGIPSDEDNDYTNDPNDEDYQVDENSDLTDSDQESNDGDESEDDLDMNPNEKVNRKKKSNINVNQFLHPSINLSGMSSFKQEFLLRVLLRKRHILRNENAYNKRVNKRYMESHRGKYFIDYNSKTDTLSMKNVTIHLEDKDESNQYIQCAQCGYRIDCTGSRKRRVRTDLKMIEHILGHHLKKFRCDKDGKTFCSRKSYSEHVQMCQKGIVGCHVCDICGRTVKRRRALLEHKRTHMNQEEKNQAKSSRRKEDRVNKMIKKGDGVVEGEENKCQCSVCGKSFRHPSGLKKHQDTHLDREERLIICAVCGKEVLNATFLSSHSKTCQPSGEELPRVKCTQCSVTCKNIFWMKRHVKRMHSENSNDRPNVCEVCGKGFKTGWDLTNHMTSHSNVTPFECGKGCGKWFKRKAHCTRHEKICKSSKDVE